MTLTTTVRINWPVPAQKLLDDMTVFCGGNLVAVKRSVLRAGEKHPFWKEVIERDEIRNQIAQGLDSLLSVTWGEEPDTGYDDCPMPPALVTLSMDNPYSSSVGGYENAALVHAHHLLPQVVKWLDEQGVPRDAWWWEDEGWGTFYPGTVDVRLLCDPTNLDRRGPPWEPVEC